MNSSMPSAERVVFLDNIRWFMILLVVVLHSAVAYSNTVPWWHVLDSHRSQLFDVLTSVLDVFLMPVLFFISGYFAVPSLRRRGTGRFLGAKLKRLGVPLVVLSIFYTPIMPYLRHRGSVADPSGFFGYWKAQMASAFDLGFHHAENTTTILQHGDAFLQHHLWFLSLLLLFFLVFAAGYSVRDAFRKRWPSAVSQDPKATTGRMITAMILAGVMIATGFAAINLVSRDGAWVKIGSILLVQPTRVPLYIGLFALGIYGRSRNWFVQHPLPGPVLPWGIASLFMLLLLLALGESFYAHNPAPLGVALTHGLVRAFFCLAFLGLFTSIGVRYWNLPTKRNRSLSESSYDVYLLHLPLVVVLQFLFLVPDIPIGIKFMSIAATAFLMSWGLSTFLVRPYPRSAVAVLLTGFAVLVVFLR